MASVGSVGAEASVLNGQRTLRGSSVREASGWSLGGDFECPSVQIDGESVKFIFNLKYMSP